MREDIASIRKEYTREKLDENSVAKNPFEQFERWFQEALKGELIEPTAMVLATVSFDGQPVQRTVLLKSYNEDGFVFYTNYQSRKAGHIDKNPKVSLLFPWYGLERQVTITGKVKKVSTRESLQYFLTRPRGSQIGAWVSNQSEVITSRNILETKLAEMNRKFKEGKVPLPDNWGGYRLEPGSFEFWQGRESRLHDRIYYEIVEENWRISRLSP